jgi:carboxypeptidase D
VDRAGFPNDTLFFWAWESQNGSLTASMGERSGEPWGIWLNGGYVLDLFNEGVVLREQRPGSSSLVGLLQEVRHFLIHSHYWG